METYKSEFITFMVRSGVLAFGDFTTKSGRRTPYFVNTGRYRTGAQMNRLGRFYADAIQDRLAGEVDVLFGPAYKGIPLVIATSMALAAHHGRDVAWCFDRKEVKDHGEGGALVGHPLADGDRVLIVEDVTTAGTSIRQAVPLLRAAADVELAGLVVSVDRMERGSGLKMGQVIGQTNARGEHPVERIMDSNCLLATLYEKFGIDFHKAYHDNSGRPVPILNDGEPIRELL